MLGFIGLLGRLPTLPTSLSWHASRWVGILARLRALEVRNIAGVFQKISGAALATSCWLQTKLCPFTAKMEVLFHDEPCTPTFV
jgi:hypothetical protein